jgi:hypothetical protein
MKKTAKGITWTLAIPAIGSMAASQFQPHVLHGAAIQSSLQFGRGGGMSADMDPWQASVEKRLDSLDRRAEAVSADVAQVKVALATLGERVSHLPSKSYIDTRLAGMLALIAAIILFADKIKALIG